MKLIPTQKGTLGSSMVSSRANYGETEVTKFDLDTDGYEEFGMELFDRKVKNFFNDKFYFDLGPPDNSSTFADLLKKGFILGKF